MALLMQRSVKGHEDQFLPLRLSARFCDQEADRRRDPRQWARRAATDLRAPFHTPPSYRFTLDAPWIVDIELDDLNARSMRSNRSR
jgi:hypothetical protein